MSNFIQSVSCGAEDAELLAKEINIKPEEIMNLKEKEHEAYVGIGKKAHKVLMFPGVETAEYKPEPEVKEDEMDFLSDWWIEL